MDRNVSLEVGFTKIGKSPPARVAWIETKQSENLQERQLVATREGGVDRNLIISAISDPTAVATREGGVDRNLAWAKRNDVIISRHPRGWRG